MSSLVTTYGSSADFDGGDISGMSFTEEERTALEEQFKERSEEILQQLGGGVPVRKNTAAKGERK